MKIAVCIKQVPSRDWQPRINESRDWIREQDASFEMNEPDAYALEEGLRLKEKHGGEVVVCSAGPARVSQVLREAKEKQKRPGSARSYKADRFFERIGRIF
jgi:electron transfer flavoprotein beta subunit